MANGYSGSATHEPSENAFFSVGEIRPPTDADFDHFLMLADCCDGWIIKYNKNDIVVRMKEREGSAVKIFKVSLCTYNHDTTRPR